MRDQGGGALGEIFVPQAVRPKAMAATKNHCCFMRPPIVFIDWCLPGAARDYAWVSQCQVQQR
jgi:hypothetical protein